MTATPTSSQIHRILILRLSAVGDIIHGLPVVRALKHHKPRMHIAWLVEDRYSCLLKNVREVDEIIQIPRREWKASGSLVQTIRQARLIRYLLWEKKFDASLDLQGLTKSALWPWWAGIPFRIGFGGVDGRELSRFLNNHRIKPDHRCRNVVDRNLALLGPLGVLQPKVDLSLPPDPLAAQSIGQKLHPLSGMNKPLALLQPGAGWETKRWPLEYFSKLGDWLMERFGYQVMILWGPGEKAMAESVFTGMKSGCVLAPETDLLELIELIRRSSLFVGGDTGPMHMAAALGVPTVAIFGGSDPERNGPYGPGHLVLTAPVECRPCWKAHCDHLSCLRKLTPERVMEKIETYLGNR